MVGSGPNGLAAAIHLAQAGLAVEVYEAAETLGGGTRSAEITLPGFTHDLGSAVHPLGISSPFFSTLPLAAAGLEWIQPPVPLAHPLDDGTAVLLRRDLAETAGQFDSETRSTWKNIFRPLVENWSGLVDELLRPLRIPHRHPFLMAGFGAGAVQPATLFARTWFRDDRARALFAGNAAHSFLKLEAPLSSAYGLMLAAAGHAVGWPIPKGGAQSIANALSNVLESLSGRIRTKTHIDSLSQLGRPDLILCDVSPSQLLSLSDNQLPKTYRRLLQNYRYGPGAFKVDWALSEPIPWRAKQCLEAGTVHVGGTLDEITEYERSVANGRPTDRPFILLAQPSLFDPSRAPDGKQTVWAYCHVPNAWPESMLEKMEAQIERFAPGFTECILARRVHSPAQMEEWDENLIGGDIIGGAGDLLQFVLRPTWRQYSTPIEGVYLCSSSTPPTGGVHGMCGFHAARWALEWLNKSS